MAAKSVVGYGPWKFGSANGHAGPQPIRTDPAPRALRDLPGMPELPREPRPPRVRDRAAWWLRSAMVALAVLGGSAAVVSWSAQFLFIHHAKHNPVIAGLEAGIPDAAALCFAALGIALALHGKRAFRARALNVASVATSVFMNFAASSDGWRSVAIWTLPPVFYALASDTLITVIRARAVALQRAMRDGLADDELSPMYLLGRGLLYGLRLVAAPLSTARGARLALLAATPLPTPEPKAAIQPATAVIEPAAVADAGRPAAIAAAPAPKRPARRRPAKSKTARFLALVTEHHGPLAQVPLADVARISGELAPKVRLHPGSARGALRRAVLAAQEGSAA